MKLFLSFKEDRRRKEGKVYLSWLLLPTYSSFLIFFISSYGFKLPFCVISFQLEHFLPCIAGMLIRNSLSLVTWECVYFTFILKDSFARYRIYGSWGFVFFFFLSILNMSVYCLWPPFFSHENSAVSHTVAALYMMSHFSLATFKILSLPFSKLAKRVYVDLFWVHPTRFTELLETVNYCFLYISEVLGHHFFKYFFLSLSLFLLLLGFPLQIYWYTWSCPTGLQGTDYFSSVTFSLFFRLDFSLLIFQVCWFILLPPKICYWTHLVNFSFHLLYFSTLEFPFCSFLSFPLPYWDSLVVESLSYFPLRYGFF